MKSAHSGNLRQVVQPQIEMTVFRDMLQDALETHSGHAPLGRYRTGRISSILLQESDRKRHGQQIPVEGAHRPVCLHLTFHLGKQKTQLFVFKSPSVCELRSSLPPQFLSRAKKKRFIERYHDTLGGSIPAQPVLGSRGQENEGALIGLLPFLFPVATPLHLDRAARLHVQAKGGMLVFWDLDRTDAVLLDDQTVPWREDVISRRGARKEWNDLLVSDH